MTEYQLRVVMDFMARHGGYVTINMVADGVGMSWETAKKNLIYLEKLE